MYIRINWLCNMLSVNNKVLHNDTTVLPSHPDSVNRCCTRKVLYKRLPILQWLPKYTFKDHGVSDLVAGITVGLTVIPQAIAFANVAGLPPQIGLYSSFMACFVYTVFGSCKDPALGPTAIMAIMTRENIHDMGPEFAILLCFITGIVQLIMGFAQLGFLIDFISGPVSAGFTSAAAIVIATSQLKDLLGINIKSSSFIGFWDQLVIHIKEISIGDGTLGITCMVVLLLLRKMKDIQIGPVEDKEKTTGQRTLSSIIWLISTARNIIVVVFCAVLGYMYKENGNLPFKLSSHVESGLPDFKAPPFESRVGNETYNFVDMASKLGSGILVVPLLSILENISLAKFFADGKTVDATQEMLALGACNLISSFVGSMPISGALSRGAVNNASGVKTPFGGVYTGIIVIIALQFFTPYLVYIPKAALAAVIIAAVVFMVELHVVKPMWRTKKIDLIPAFATFLCSLLIRLEIGIVVGIAINVIILLYTLARPSVHVEKQQSEFGYEYLVITPDRSLVFPSVEYVRAVVSKAGLKQGLSSIPVVMDCRHIQGADFTAAKGIKSLIDDFVRRNQPLVFYNVKPSVISIFQGVRPAEFNYCATEQHLHEMLKGYYFTRMQTLTL
ncbi:sodium-independent sulfate anion transporter-like isoform X2 [Sipha flava]|uniref:Sodium-independent sulfate anion transporter-like isoform X2 n=1 Tax=Sipha flava TaxID=143950 RepID=A0A8B8FUK8_9HEMI|nr:sodium-independent sulfate anion transporter-like isoform X2 [Sipha flava]